MKPIEYVNSYDSGGAVEERCDEWLIDSLDCKVFFRWPVDVFMVHSLAERSSEYVP